MPRYHLITSTHLSGGYSEYTAADDAAAVTKAESKLYGRERIVYLSEVNTTAASEQHRQIIPAKG